MRQLRSASASWGYDAVKRTAACKSPGFLLRGSLLGVRDKFSEQNKDILHRHRTYLMCPVPTLLFSDTVKLGGDIVDG